jgi:hypothetical protein
MTQAEQKFDNSVYIALRTAIKDFPEAVETLNRLSELIFTKGKEYRRNNDPYHNFKQGAKLQNVRPMTVLNGFRLKHEISVADLLKDFNKHKPVSLDQVNEKFDDILVYTLIELAYVENEGEVSFAYYRKFIEVLKKKTKFIKNINARV